MNFQKILGPFYNAKIHNFNVHNSQIHSDSVRVKSSVFYFSLISAYCQLINFIVIIVWNQ